MSNEKQKPVKQFRAGAIGVSVWQREHQGQTYYSASASRAYTKDDGKTFEYTDNFGRDELPVAASLLNLAFTWIVAQSSKAK